MGPMLFSGSLRRKKWSKYQENGVDRKRAKHALTAEGNKCGCKARCFKQFSVKRLLGICTLFWMMQKPSQDALLWACQHNGDDDDPTDEDASSQDLPRRRHLWVLDGAQPEM
jgi:hypothetical protein